MKSARLPWFIAGALALVLVAGAGVGAWALLRDDESRTTGTCDAALYELSIEPDDGRLEATFELTSAAPGETWDVVLQQDGEVLLQGERVTDEDAELDIDVPARDGGGDFTVTATPESGSACTVELTHS